MATVTDAEISSIVSVMVDAAEELATAALGLDGAELVAVGERAPERSDGAYVPLTSDTTTFQFGVVATTETCTALSKDLLGMEQDEELSAVDVADTMGEIANIMAGGLKSRMVDTDPGLKLGLPVVIRGEIQPSPSLEFVSAEVLIGTHRTWLVSIRHQI